MKQTMRKLTIVASLSTFALTVRADTSGTAQNVAGVVDYSLFGATSGTVSTTSGVVSAQAILGVANVTRTAGTYQLRNYGVRGFVETVNGGARYDYDCACVGGSQCR